MASAPNAELLLRDLREQLLELDPDALIDELTLECEIAALGLDSMTMISAIAEIESRYAIRLEAAELTGLETVAQLIALVQHHIEAREEEGSASGCPSCQSPI